MNYYSLRELRQFWRDVCYTPNAQGGAYCRKSQKKRRKQARRAGRRAKR